MCDIRPLKIAIRYDPPQIALIYALHKEGLEIDRKVHLMDLQDLGEGADAGRVCRRLFREHADYLDPFTVQLSQIKRLVERIQAKAPTNKFSE